MTQNNNLERKEGVVIETLPNALFRVKLEDDIEILAYVSGKMRIHNIRILVGDRVTLELASGDTRGRIVYRNK